MGMSGVIVAIGFIAMVGCGGRLDGGADRDEPRESGSGDDSVSSETESDVWAPRPTGDCEGGSEPDDLGDDETCEWLAEDKCYESKDGACACICPRGTESVCWSEWPSPDGGTVVRCTAVDD